MKNLIIVLYLFLSGITWSQNVYFIDQTFPVHDLMPKLLIIEDVDGDLDQNSLLHDSTLHLQHRSAFGRLLNVGSTYWGKIDIFSTDSLVGWTLSFEDKMIGPPAWTKSNGKIDVYGYVEGDLIFHEKTGVEYPQRERSTSSHWVLNEVSLDHLPINQKITILIKAKGNSIGYPPYFNLSVRHPRHSFYHQIFEFNNSFNLFLFGITFIMFLYHIVHFFYLKDRVYLWFSIWLFFCVLTYSMANGLIIGSVTKFRFTIFLIIANGIFYTFWFFGRSFIDSKKKFPIIDKFMLWLALGLVIEIIAMIVYHLAFNGSAYFTGIGIHYMIINVYTIASLTLSVILVSKKDLFAKYFGIGSLVATALLIVGILWAMQIINPTRTFGDPFAYAIFLQVIIYSIGIAYRRQVLNNQRQEERLKAQQTYAEMQRIKDLDEIKTRFFANISHEFRTPLSLIKGPLNRAKNQSTTDDITLSTKAFKVIDSNTNRLQSLIDQLLDLSKLESGKVHLSLKHDNIIKHIRSLVFSFESLAERKNISLNTQFPGDIEKALFDKDKLEKIVGNLLSNAFKYTSDNGSVTVIVGQTNGSVTIEISDTGKGIGKDELKLVFDRFYRVEGSEEKGSGIGLSLVKELVDLHNGNLSVDSVIGQGTTFKVTLPITLEGLPKSNSVIEDISEKPHNELIQTDTLEVEQPVESNGLIKELSVALVVEDNDDLRFFITDIIKDQYEVLTAENGIQGERMAFEHIPDIVISDIMMPKKDGYELCHSLKTSPKTSHIPIIMLTAKAGQDSKIEGLTQGADAYLTKPFDEKELILRMKNLIDSRKKLWEYFKALDMLLIDDIDVNSIDDKFLQDVFSCIKNNIDNEQFSVEDIARYVGFSRSQLHRKLKALSDKSANQLITEMRLNEAHRMLKLKAGSVSEIAYSVGYSNLSYFTKSFKEKFGTLPSKV